MFAVRAVPGRRGARRGGEASRRARRGHHRRQTLMKAVKNTYSEFAGGPIKTKLISLDTSSCLVHQSGFLKNIYRLLNNKYLMEDAQWLPLDEKKNE